MTPISSALAAELLKTAQVKPMTPPSLMNRAGQALARAGSAVAQGVGRARDAYIAQTRTWDNALQRKYYAALQRVPDPVRRYWDGGSRAYSPVSSQEYAMNQGKPLAFNRTFGLTQQGSKVIPAPATAGTYRPTYYPVPAVRQTSSAAGIDFRAPTRARS